MKRTFALSATTALLLSAGSVPASGATTPLATQDNVRLVKNVPGATGGHAVVEGNRLYVGAYGMGMRIFNIANPRNPVQVGEYMPGPHVDGMTVDLGARADAVPDAAVFDGRHIVTLNGTSRATNQGAAGVTVRGTQQTEFIDATDAADPVLLHRFNQPAQPGEEFGEAHNGDILDARRLWFPSGGRDNNILRIYDMSPLLQTPPQAPVRLFRADPYTLWQESPYRINQGKSAGTNPSGSHTHDIEVYADVRILLPEWEWDIDPETGEKIPTHADKDIALMATSTGYAVDGPGANNGSVYIVDITDPTEPVVINRWQNPSQNTNSIRYLHEVQFLDGDFSTLVVTDEDLHSGCDSGRLYTVRVSEDLMEATKAAEWAVGEGQAGSPACAGSHVFSSHDRHVYMGAYVSGLQVVDLRDPAQPKRAGRYIAEGANYWGALYHAGVIYAGDFGGRGLDVLEHIKDPVARGLVKVNNPSQTTAAGVTETLTECDTDSPFDEIDGMLVEIPPDKRSGESIIRALGASTGTDVPYDLNVYFYFPNCAFYSGASLNSPDPDEEGPIPEGAGFAYIDLITGPPMHVYAQIDP